jgi:hypothetical protein
MATQRRMDFSENNTLFFLLNILGHDIYHDYFGANNDDRLIRSILELNKIYEIYNPVAPGGGGKENSKNYRSTTTLSSPSSVIVNKYKQASKSKHPSHNYGPPGNNPGININPNLSSQKLQVSAINRHRGTSKLGKTVLAATGMIKAADKFKSTVKNNSIFTDDQSIRLKQIFMTNSVSLKRQENIDEMVKNISHEIQVSFIFNLFSIQFLTLTSEQNQSHSAAEILKNLNLTMGEIFINLGQGILPQINSTLVFNLLIKIFTYSVNSKDINGDDVGEQEYSEMHNSIINIFLFIICVFMQSTNQLVDSQIVTTSKVIDNFIVFLNDDNINEIILYFYKNKIAGVFEEGEEVEGDEGEEGDEEGEGEGWGGGAVKSGNTSVSSAEYMSYVTFLNTLPNTAEEYNELKGNLEKKKKTMMTELQIGKFFDNLHFFSTFTNQFKTIEDMRTCITKASRSFNSNISEEDKTKRIAPIFKKFFDELIVHYTEKAAVELLLENALAATVQAAADLVEAKKTARLALQAALLLTGGLANRHKDLRDDFITTLIKMTLMNCNIFICPYSTEPEKLDSTIPINTLFNNLTQATAPDLYTEIRILTRHANLISTTWGSKITESADDALFNFFKQTTTNNIFPLLPTGNNRYVISNAGNFSSIIDATKAADAIFCPVSTLLDGATSSSTNPREKGNMDFRIGPVSTDNAYYNGLCTKLAAPDAYRYTINIKFPTFAAFQIFKDMTVKVSGKDLTAANVLFNTLTDLHDFMVAHPIDAPLPPGRGIFDHYYRYNSNNIDFFKKMYYIAFKGTGDLFQEVNAAFKFGGYSEASTQETNVVRFTTGGDALRGFAANDRPSGCRFVKFVRDGSPAQVNQKAYGGYMGDSRQMVFIRKGATTIKLGGNHIKTRISRRKPRISRRNTKRKHRISRRSTRFSKRKTRFSRRTPKRKTRK